MQIRQQYRCPNFIAPLVALSLGFAAPRVRAGPALEVKAAPVELLIDTSLLEQALGDRLQIALEERLTKVLVEDGFVVVSEGADVTIVVYIEMPDPALREYAISLEMLIDRREVMASAVPCLACSEKRVVEEMAALLPRVAERLSAREPPSPVVVEPEPAPVNDDPVLLKLGPMGLSGAVTLAGGVTSVAAGLVLTSLQKDAAARFDLNPRAVGASIIVVGGLAVALGIAAVVVDVELLQRRRRPRSPQISADLSTTRAGLSLSGRF